MLPRWGRSFNIVSNEANPAETEELMKKEVASTCSDCEDGEQTHFPRVETQVD